MSLPAKSIVKAALQEMMNTGEKYIWLKHILTLRDHYDIKAPADSTPREQEKLKEIIKRKETKLIKTQNKTKRGEQLLTCEGIRKIQLTKTTLGGEHDRHW